MPKPLLKDKIDAPQPYADLQKEFVAQARAALGGLKTEITERNTNILTRDSYIYGKMLEQSLDIPAGHDHTPVNWLRRTVEIHKIQFMGRPFQIVSTYNTKDESASEDDNDAARLKLENKKQKEYAELRKTTIDAIIIDNGGHALFMDGAESASAVGDWIVKCWYDEENHKYVISPIEAVENCYVLWKQNDYREVEAFSYLYQVSLHSAISDFGCSEDVAISALGQPLEFTGTAAQTMPGGQPMVTVMEITGKLSGWASDKGILKKVDKGQETELNALIIGNEVKRVIDDDKKLPRHYIFPNKKQRRRPWGASDVSDAAININLSYVETLSDWRTVASKVNFPKFKGYNFGPDVQMPKYQNRKIQIIPLGEGQDIQPLPLGDANGQDFNSQMSELKEQFVRETGISRVLFDDPSVTLNSNQALLTSMKPTSDIAESKKQLWGPILTRLFTDAIHVIAQYDDTVKELADETDPWQLKLQWPSVMQKEDPVYQQMLLNRFNAGTLSVQSYLEAQGDSKEEIDRIRDEIGDPITAAILSRGLPEVARKAIYEFIGMPPWGYITPKVSLRGDLAPQEVGNMAHNYQWDQGPYGPNIGPQGFEGTQANQDFINKGFVKDTPNGPQAQYQGPQNTPANNQPGTGVTSQPGSGATTTSSQGALNQTTQQQGG